MEAVGKTTVEPDHTNQEVLVTTEVPEVTLTIKRNKKELDQHIDDLCHVRDSMWPPEPVPLNLFGVGLIVVLSCWCLFNLGWTLAIMWRAM